MITPNPIAVRYPAGFHESSGQRSPRDEDALGRVWKKHAENAQGLANMGQNMRQVQRQLDRLRRRVGTPPVTPDAAYFPFQLLPSPTLTNTQADAAEPGSTAADVQWRTFRVRAGSLKLVPVEKTDGADSNPDDPNVDPNPDYDAAIDIVVPAAQSKYYIYIDNTTDPEHPVIAHSDTAPGNWWDGGYYIIATVDTTDEANKVAQPRQYRRQDILEGGGSNECPAG